MWLWMISCGMQYDSLVWQHLIERHLSALSQAKTDYSHAQSFLFMFYTCLIRLKIAEKDVKPTNTTLSKPDILCHSWWWWQRRATNHNRCSLVQGGVIVSVTQKAQYGIEADDSTSSKLDKPQVGAVKERAIVAMSSKMLLWTASNHDAECNSMLHLTII